MAGQSPKLSTPQSSEQDDLRAKRSRLGKKSRRKGQVFEREFFHLLSEHLGTVVRRNVDQARNGGADGIEVPGWAIEVKRHESGFRSEWWEQAKSQAIHEERIPALAYRASRQPWRVRVFLLDVCDVLGPWTRTGLSRDHWIETDLMTFALIVRESL